MKQVILNSYMYGLLIIMLHYIHKLNRFYKKGKGSRGQKSDKS